MADFQGGRGKRVTYGTQMYRIPNPLRPTVERLGMQFRLLWEGLIDPKGEKLISRIEAAIPDPEQLGEGYTRSSIPNIKNKALDDDDPEDEFDSEDDLGEPNDAEVILAQSARIQALQNEVRLLEREKAELQSQLTEQSASTNQSEDAAQQFHSELLTLKNEAWLWDKKRTLLESKIAELQEQLSRSLVTLDLEAERDRFLAGLRCGKQAPEYKRSLATIDRFIAQLMRSDTKSGS